MRVVQEIALTDHSGRHYQATSDSMAGIKFDQTMEYQVDTKTVH